MVRYDILGGLELALSKGESLQRAMQTFFNAGYKVEEVEEAARFLQGSIENVQLPTKIVAPKVIEKPKTIEIQMPAQITVQTPKPEIKKEAKQEIKIPEPTIKIKPLPQQAKELPKQEQIQKSVQNVSSYEKRGVSARTMIIIFLSVILFFLLAALVGTLVFRGVLLEFFNSFFN